MNIHFTSYFICWGEQKGGFGLNPGLPDFPSAQVIFGFLFGISRIRTKMEVLYPAW